MRRLRLRVPHEHGALLTVPNLGDWPALLEQNRRFFETTSARLGGLSLQELRTLARRETLAAATTYLAERGQSLSFAPPADALLIATGHQPELYHPGVWIKSFAVNALASRYGGRAVGLHVLADNDTLKRSAIAVPSGEPDAPVLAYVPFDRVEGEIPFEERAVLDEEVFAQFPVRVMQEMSAYPFHPIVDEYWDAVRESRRLTPLVGERLAFGRRRLERQWDCENLEVPLCRLAAGEAFRRLAADLLLNAERFAQIHNRALREYRQLNRIRSRHHPVPALEAATPRVETSFWAWRVESLQESQNIRRERVFVAKERDLLTIFADDRPVAAIPFGEQEPVADVARALAKIGNAWKLRPRALTTTFFLRLAVSDLFVHGVGGGKYDELADEIFAQFLQTDVPRFAILSATALLPLGETESEEDRRRELAFQERDLVWNPDRYLDDHLRDQEPIARWIEQKYEQRAAVDGSKHERRERFHRFRDLNQRLRQYLGSLPQELASQREQLEEKETSRALLGSREFAFCLHPADSLQSLFREAQSPLSLPSP